jgi:hypothetical protein
VEVARLVDLQSSWCGVALVSCSSASCWCSLACRVDRARGAVGGAAVSDGAGGGEPSYCVSNTCTSCGWYEYFETLIMFHSRTY